MQSHFPQWKNVLTKKESFMPRHKKDMTLAQQAAAAQNTSQNAKNLKKYYYALLRVANYARTLSRHRQKYVYLHALSSKVNVLRKSKNKNCRGISFLKISSARAKLTTLKWLQ